MAPRVEFNPAPPPSLSTGVKGEREVKRRATSFATVSGGSGHVADEVIVDDVLQPDAPFEADPYESSRYIDGDVRAVSSRAIVFDSDGALIDWPWESGSARHTGGKRRRHRLDRIVQQGLFASTADGKMGSNSTGVRKWRAFCAAEGTTPARPMDGNTVPLHAKLEEELLIMRFAAYLVEGGVLPSTAAGYVGQAQGWHAKQYGVKLAAGMKLSRLPAMLKGLRRVYGEGGRAVRRGFAPQALRAAMDMLLDPANPEHANILATLALAFQGLLRGAECTVDGKFSPVSDLTRADIVSLTEKRLVLMMRPCKNMHHLSGKTVPLIIGAGGTFIDAVAEVRNLFLVDPVSVEEAPTTPLFRTGPIGGERKPLRSDVLRQWVKTLAVRNGDVPEQFGTHSMRIGGATALFAAGADPTIIRTMGRWSSDCYRLYVRACFEQTLAWSTRAGSTVVSDVAQEFEEVDSY